MRGFLIAAMIVVGGGAAAHPVDCDSKMQPVEIKSSCCGTEDYRALKPDQVREDGEGFDVFLEGKWRRAKNRNGEWLVAQPTGAACWGIWYRLGQLLDGGTREQWTDHNGNTEDYAFYCLERPAAF